MICHVIINKYIYISDILSDIFPGILFNNYIRLYSNILSGTKHDFLSGVYSDYSKKRNETGQLTIFRWPNSTPKAWSEKCPQGPTDVSLFNDVFGNFSRWT